MEAYQSELRTRHKNGEWLCWPDLLSRKKRKDFYSNCDRGIAAGKVIFSVIGNIS